MLNANVLQALRLAVRRLRHSPGFAILATVCLAVGLGSVITVFSIVNALFLRPLPGVERADELVTLHFEGPASVPNVRDIRESGAGLVGVGAFTSDLATVRVNDVADRVLATAANAEYFEVLGTRPALGRFFLTEEDGPPGAHPMAVVSYDYWRSRLDSDPEALGRTVRVNGTPVGIVGVAPEGFLGSFRGFPVDVWLPLSMAGAVTPGFDPADRSSGGLELVARLGDGATFESVRAALSTTVAPRMAAAHPDVNEGFRIEVHRYSGFDEEVRAPVLALVAVLLAIAGLVLLIACLNFTNMLLARSAERLKDAAIRRALGGERGELLASFLGENLLIALVGAGGGLLVAQRLSEALAGFLRVLPVRIHLDFGLDWRVLVVSSALAVAVAVSTGLVPAARVAGHDLTSALKGTAGTGAGNLPLLRLLLGAQLAGSAALLVIAGLFLQAVTRVTAVNPGFRIDGLQVVPFLDASVLGREDAGIADFYQRMVTRATAIPGVVDAAVASSVPLAFGGLASTRIDVPELEPPTGEDGFDAGVAVVSPGYGRTMGIPLLSGRELRTDDGPGRPRVALVSAAMAGRFWPGEDPLGRRFTYLGTEVEIVGVLADVAARVDGTPAVVFYVPHAQRPEGDMNLFLRVAPGAGPVAAELRTALRSLDPDLPAVEPRPLGEYLLLSLAPQRIAATVGGGLGLAGLLLAALGVYGLVAFYVVRRRREIGVRMALGADGKTVLLLVFGDTLRLAAWGVGAGLLVALAAGQVIRSLLVGVSPADPLPFAAGALAVLLFAALATWAPARRAAGLDPMVALTTE